MTHIRGTCLLLQMQWAAAFYVHTVCREACAPRPLPCSPSPTPLSYGLSTKKFGDAHEVPKLMPYLTICAVFSAELNSFICCHLG